MNILVIGGGGREHALVLALKKSARASKIFCTPGNAGIAEVAEVLPCEPHPVAWADFVVQHGIEFTVVGPDNALESGIVDEFEARGLSIFGPTRAAARLEWSKSFAKDFMVRNKIPTAQHQSFTQLSDALEYVRQQGAPIVVKDSGLALGKGVTVAHTLEDAERALEAIFTTESGETGRGEVVVEEFMTGMEVSCLAFCDGVRAIMLPMSQDHKTIFEGDVGPMTGGMGVIAPFPLSPEQLEEIQTRILEAILRGMALEGTPFRGMLYPGLMLTPQGIRVVEINARFGDPEAECLLPLLESDPLEILLACSEGRLTADLVRFSLDSSAVVVMASPGYPAGSTRGIPLELPDVLPSRVTVFHCATARENKDTNAQLVSSGGRVLAVQATASTLEDALKQAYDVVQTIGFKGAQYRRDIGFRLRESLNN
jgi:phosphoribosylamine---glycine ligase